MTSHSFLIPKPHHLLALLAQAFDAERDHVARLQEPRRLLALADTRRRPSGDHVAGMEHKNLEQVGEEIFAVEDHGRGRAGLHALAVDVEPHRERLRPRHLVLGHEPRAERSESLAALALGPLPGAFELKGALRYVVGDAIAGDVIECVLLRDVTRARAD